MFETFRKHNRWLVPAVMGTAAVALVGTGNYMYTSMKGAAEPPVAEVDGEPVTQREADVAHRDRVEQLAARFGASFDPRMLDTEAQRTASLDGLLTERALTREARRLRMGVSDARLREVISQVPQFQKDGRFDKETYIALLRSRGFTGESFDARVRADLVRQTLEGGVAGSGLVPRTVAAQLVALERDRRKVRVLQFPADKAMARAQVDDARVQADYDANRERYRTPESVTVELVALRLEDIAAGLAVSEADERAYYQQNLSRWSAPEQRRASHILFTVGKDGSAADAAGARKLAEDALREVKARPTEFARIARERSKDAISAAQGGDLGWFGRGDMVKPFSDAAFALHDGELSAVVASEFGFHVIRVTGARGGGSRSFEEVRASIESEMRRQSAQKAYSDAAESFSNFVYEQPDSLEAAAKKFQLSLQRVEGVTRQGPLPPAVAAWFPPQLLEALFAPESIAKKHNTKAFEAGANTLVSARVLEHKPASTRPLAEVRAQILARLQHDEAIEIARREGKARLEALAKAADDAGFEAPREIGRHDAQVLPAAALNQVFAVPADKLPAFVGVDVPGTGFAIVHVLSADQAPAPSAEAIQGMQGALAERAGAVDAQAFEQAVRERMGVKITAAPKKAAS